MGALSIVADNAPAAIRLFRLEGDAMEPRLRGGDFLMVAAADGYRYEGVYLLDFGEGESPFLVQRRIGGEFFIRRVNPKYSDATITVEEFAAAVAAMSVAEVRVTDHRQIQATHAAPQACR